MITRGTTPTLTFTLQDNDGNNVDLSEYEVLYITIQDSKKNQFDIDKSRFVFKEDFSFVAKLTQEETLKLVDGRIKVQLRAKSQGGDAIAYSEVENSAGGLTVTIGGLAPNV